jgi:bacteriorhodopsin
MINSILIVGMVVFAVSTITFFFSKKKSERMNSAFLVSFFTLASYVLMWQGSFVAEGANGQPIYWTRWLFYAISCSLLMLEIARVKGIKSTGRITELIFLNVFVMGTGTLAAVSSGLPKWLFFVLSSLAYVIQIGMVLKDKAKESNWVNIYIYLGWTGFPIVFFLAATGIGLIGTAVALGLYMLLDIYTKIVFNIQLKE